MQPPLEDLQRVLKTWTFHWGVMDVLIGGRSSIDLTDLRFKNWHDATEFLRYYGFDPDRPSHSRQIHAVIVEAWSFIEKYLMPVEWRRGKRPPDKLLYAEDARDIILAASDLRSETQLTQIWACSVLRVMHTIAHIEGVQRLLDSVAAREQIIGRFRDLIFRDDKGDLRFGKKEMNVAVHHIEWKHRKTRESMILKLLHKPANVAETIYDMIGVRIVTQRLCDAMVVVKFLRDFHVVSFANCIPSRARNNLLDTSDFRKNLDMMRRLLKEQKISIEEFNHFLEGMTKPSKKRSSSSNPHSRRSYRSIQLTCRQLIRYHDPHKAWLEKLQRLKAAGELSNDVTALVDDILRLSGVGGSHFSEGSFDSDMVGFFPFEIQIMDLKSFQNNLAGDANHLAYKKSQVRASRRRVLASVLTYKDAD